MSWRECLLTATFRATSIDVISAGKKSDDYRKRVQQLDWTSLFRDHDIGNFLDGLREEWRRTYDFILIDSRTGITDIGDICTVLLPDVIVAVLVSNYQNVDGVKSSIERARAARRKLPVNRSMLMIVPLNGRDESNTEYELSMRWRDIFEREFNYLFKEWLPKEILPSEALARLFIPYVPVWSFGERIPVLESWRELHDPTSIGAAYVRLATLLTAELDWYAVFEKTNIEDLRTTKIELGTTLREYDSLKTTQKMRQSRTRWWLAGVSVSAGIAAGIVSFLYGEFRTREVSLPEVTYRFCSGEFESRCPQNTIFQLCGFSASEWAKTRCTSFRTKQLSDDPGNRCGYSIVEVVCTPLRGDQIK